MCIIKPETVIEESDKEIRYCECNVVHTRLGMDFCHAHNDEARTAIARVIGCISRVEYDVCEDCISNGEIVQRYQ